SDLERAGQMPHQRAKEFIAGTARRPLCNVAKRLFNTLAIGDVTNDNGCFSRTGKILIKRAGYFSEKCRAVLAFIEELTAEAPRALSFCQQGLQSVIRGIHESEACDAADLLRAPSE